MQLCHLKAIISTVPAIHGPLTSQSILRCCTAEWFSFDRIDFSPVKKMHEDLSRKEDSAVITSLIVESCSDCFEQIHSLPCWEFRTVCKLPLYVFFFFFLNILRLIIQQFAVGKQRKQCVSVMFLLHWCCLFMSFWLLSVRLLIRIVWFLKSGWKFFLKTSAAARRLVKMRLLRPVYKCRCVATCWFYWIKLAFRSPRSGILGCVTSLE